MIPSARMPAAADLAPDSGSPEPPRDPPRRRRRRRRWPLLLLLLLMAGLAAELVYRAKPDLLPLWYREQYPVRGIEFFQPGILSATPTEGYPIPGPQQSYTGPPPQGLVRPAFLVDPSVDIDVVRYPRVVLRVDELSFPNERRPDTTDILFVGDSFMVSSGVQDPPGLQPLLAEATGRDVYNLGIAGIGPRRERWLMENYGLSLEPEVVVWFAFGGNDLTDVEKVQIDLDEGRLTYAQHKKYEPLPWSYALDLALKSLDMGPAKAPDDPPLTRGVRLGHGPDADVDVWFSPLYLRHLLLDRPSLKQHAGLPLFMEEISAAHAELTERGIPMLLVYIPTKPEVMLPFVEDQLDQLWPMVIHNLRMESPLTPEEYLAGALRNRSTFETMLRDFAAQRDLPFLSATPALTRLTEEGRLGYLSADTHWNEVGQAALLPDLIDALAAAEGR